MKMIWGLGKGLGEKMGNEKFYENLTVEVLEDYAGRTFGIKNPSDIEQFKKFISCQKKVLEVGCGTGRIGNVLIPLCQYVGVERSKKYLNVFKERLGKIKGVDLRNVSFYDFGDEEKFDVVIFPWTIIGDFNEEEQKKIFHKVYGLLNLKGICLLDNPSNEQVYNYEKFYEPVPFYCDDWKEFLVDLGFEVSSKIYRTSTGVGRELTILRKG